MISDDASDNSRLSERIILFFKIAYNSFFGIYKKIKNIYILVGKSSICFRSKLNFIAIRQAIRTQLRDRTPEGRRMSWGHIAQLLLNGVPVVIGGASIILILLQYVLLGIMLMNLFVLIMIRLDKEKLKIGINLGLRAGDQNFREK